MHLHIATRVLPPSSYSSSSRSSHPSRRVTSVRRFVEEESSGGQETIIPPLREGGPSRFRLVDVLPGVCVGGGRCLRRRTASGPPAAGVGRVGGAHLPGSGPGPGPARPRHAMLGAGRRQNQSSDGVVSAGRKWDTYLEREIVIIVIIICILSLRWLVMTWRELSTIHASCVTSWDIEGRNEGRRAGGKKIVLKYTHIRI